MGQRGRIMTGGVLLNFEGSQSRTSPLRAEAVLADQFFTEPVVNAAPLWRQSRGVVAACLLVGTGGTASGETFAWIPHDSLGCRVTVVTHTRHPSSPLLDTRERMAGLRRYLSLNVTDLAKALRVERPTIYAWLKGSSEPHLTNLRRLEKIYRLAQEWRAQSAVPLGGYVRQPSEDGQSILDHLAKEHIPEQTVRSAFSSVKSRLDRERTEKSVRRRSVDESARLHGFPSIPEATQRKNFDEATSL